MADETLVIRGGTLIDGTGAPPAEDAVIVIEGGRFKSVGANGQARVPDGAEPVDASGLTILPGFIDGHGHLEDFHGELYLHLGITTCAQIETGQDAHAQIDVARRASITRGHTATHLLHATLKDELGDHAAQAGSAIDAGRFRFDFPHFSAVSTDQLQHVEAHVNRRIGADPEISTEVMSQAEARAIGATALFGEKYGEVVRVVRIGDFSVELCGGTHVARTPDIGVFSILSEGSIAANLRRIEALTGPEALEHLARERLIAEQVAQMLKVSTDEVVDRVAGLVDRLRAAEKEIARVRQEALLATAGSLLEGAESVNGARVLAAVVSGADRDGLKTLALNLRERLGESVVVLGDVTSDGKAQLVAAVSSDLVGQGVEAREVLQPGARVVGGGAGGRGEAAQAGGPGGGGPPAERHAYPRPAPGPLPAPPRGGGATPARKYNSPPPPPQNPPPGGRRGGRGPKPPPRGPVGGGPRGGGAGGSQQTPPRGSPPAVPADRHLQARGAAGRGGPGRGTRARGGDRS